MPPSQHCFCHAPRSPSLGLPEPWCSAHRLRFPTQAVPSVSPSLASARVRLRRRVTGLNRARGQGGGGSRRGEWERGPQRNDRERVTAPRLTSQHHRSPRDLAQGRQRPSPPPITGSYKDAVTHSLQARAQGLLSAPPAGNHHSAGWNGTLPISHHHDASHRDEDPILWSPCRSWHRGNPTCCPSPLHREERCHQETKGLYRQRGRLVGHHCALPTPHHLAFGYPASNHRATHRAGLGADARGAAGLQTWGCPGALGCVSLGLGKFRNQK